MPQTIQMIRVSLPAGKHEIHLEGLSGSMTQTGEVLTKTIDVKADQKKFCGVENTKITQKSKKLFMRSLI